MRYSESTGNFYPDWANYEGQLPDDVITVPDSDYNLAMSRGIHQKVALVNCRIKLQDIDLLPVLRAKKTAKIMAAFAIEVKKPVDVGGLKFDGGWTSLDKLDRAIQFADKLGLTERTWYETDETPHVLPVRGEGITGEAILIAVALEYDRLDGKMRAMVKAVNDATTEEAVNSIAISWA